LLPAVLRDRLNWTGLKNRKSKKEKARLNYYDFYRKSIIDSAFTKGVENIIKNRILFLRGEAE